MKISFTQAALAIMVAAVLSPIAHAHGDEDHGDAKPKAVAVVGVVTSSDVSAPPERVRGASKPDCGPLLRNGRDTVACALS